MTTQPPAPLLALSPCPFCGSNAVGPLFGGSFYVACADCGAESGPLDDPDYDSGIERAITAWNTRAANARGDDGKVRLWRNAYVGMLTSEVADRRGVGYEEACLLAEEAANDMETAFEQATETLKHKALTTTPESN